MACDSAITACSGLGALNRLLLGAGLTICILNVLPMSTDCDLAMPSWLGVNHVCTPLETLLNWLWCLALGGFGLLIAAVAALPKLVDNYSAATNKTAVTITATILCLTNAVQLAIGLTFTVTIDGAKASLAYSIIARTANKPAAMDMLNDQPIFSPE